MDNYVVAISDELEKLIALRNSGEISTKEFETLKGKLINSGPVETQTVNVEIKKTTFENKCLILADLWMNERYNEHFEDFIEYNDMGLTLAYALSEGIVKGTNLSTKLVNETFDLLIASAEVEDTGFDSLDELLAAGDAL